MSSGDVGERETASVPRAASDVKRDKEEDAASRLESKSVVSTEASLPRDGGKGVLRREVMVHDSRLCVYVLTGRGREEYAAAGGGTWSLRSVFAVCTSLNGVWTVLEQNVAAEPQWRHVRCHEVPLDARLVASPPREQKAAIDVCGTENLSVLAQPLEAEAPSLDLHSLLLHFGATDEDRAAVALTLASVSRR